MKLKKITISILRPQTELHWTLMSKLFIYISTEIFYYRVNLFNGKLFSNTFLLNYPWWTISFTNLWKREGPKANWREIIVLYQQVLREKCPNPELFLVRISLYSVQIQENTDPKLLHIWTLFTQWRNKVHQTYYIHMFMNLFSKDV